MTLDEAIKHAEEVAEEKESEAQDLEYSKLGWRYEVNKCSKCAEEHRQLAEWLKDYKRLLEQEPCEDAVSKQAVREGMVKYGFHAPDMTVTEFVEDELQPVTPARKVGEWIVLRDEYGDIVEAVCSCCDANGNHKWEFCPHCSAEMRGIRG